MQSGAVDLAVAYRIYPRVSKPTLVHSGDKLRLSELALRSFRAALGELRVRIYVLLDGCPPEYEAMFLRHFGPEELELIPLEGEGNHATFARQIDLLLDQRESELVYFAEDDYLYAPGALEEMVQLIRETPDAHFVSPYDHRDYYSLRIHQYGSEVRVSERRHWRTAASTCLTFLTRRTTLARTEAVFRRYSTGRCSDASLWFSLTKKRIFRAQPWLGAALGGETLARVFTQAWFRCTRQILFGRRWKLWIPVPSLATHMESAHLAPSVDWGRMVQSLENGDTLPEGHVPVEDGFAAPGSGG